MVVLKIQKKLTTLIFSHLKIFCFTALLLYRPQKPFSYRRTIRISVFVSMCLFSLSMSHEISLRQCSMYDVRKTKIWIRKPTSTRFFECTWRFYRFLRRNVQFLISGFNFRLFEDFWANYFFLPNLNFVEHNRVICLEFRRENSENAVNNYIQTLVFNRLISKTLRKHGFSDRFFDQSVIFLWNSNCYLPCQKHSFSLQNVFPKFSLVFQKWEFL